MIMVELQPFAGNKGILLNIGVYFLWHNSSNVYWDYSRDDIRVNVRDNVFGALVFCDPNFDLNLHQMFDDADELIDYYKGLKNFNVFKHSIENRKDFIQMANRDFEKRDVCLAMVKMFEGDEEGALKILETARSFSDMTASTMLENFTDAESFKLFLVEKVNNSRKEISKIHKIKLEPIESIASFWDNVADLK